MTLLHDLTLLFMYDLIQLLIQIGLTEKESQAYLICLKIGTNPASIIAKHSELNRCTTYSVLESLIKKGLVYQVEKDTIRYFTAVGPRQLTIYLEEKKRDLSYYKNEIDSRISEFESLKHPNQVLPTIKSYSGKAGMNKLFNDSLNESFLLINAQESTAPNHFFKQYAPIFLNEKKIIHLSLRGKHLTENTRLSKSSELKTLPYCIPIELIGKQKLFILDTEDNYGIGINQTKIIESHQQQFHHLWNTKKDPSR